MSQMVMFRVGRSRYALPVDLVTEVIESPAIEPSPWTGDAILGVSRVRGHWIPVVRICNEETEAEAPIWEESTSVLVVLGRLRGRFGLRVEDFGDVFDEGAARPIDKLDGEDLIEVGGELVRYVDPVALVGSLESVFEDGGQLMSQNIATKQVKIVTFRIGSEVFGVDVMKVSEVLQLPVVTRVPRAPEFVEGLAEVREGVVPVIDMRKRFSVEIAPGSAGERLLVVDLDGVRVGLVVDVVPGVEAVANEDVSRPPEFFKGLAGRYLEGIAKKGDRLIVLLNLDEILSSAEKIELNAALEDLEPGAETKRVASKSRTTKRASRSRKKSGGKKGG